MRRRAVRVVRGKFIGRHNPADHIRADLLGAPNSPRAHKSPIGQVAQDTQSHFAARPALQLWRQRFRHRVHSIRAHRVAHIDNQMHNKKRATNAHLKVPKAPAQLHKHRVTCITELANLAREALHFSLRRCQICEPGDLHLRNHAGVIGLGENTAQFTASPRAVAHRSNNRALLRRHRNKHILAIHSQVGRDPKRHSDSPDHILRKIVGQLCERPRLKRKLSGLTLTQEP